MSIYFFLSLFDTYILPLPKNHDLGFAKFYSSTTFCSSHGRHTCVADKKKGGCFDGCYPSAEILTTRPAPALSHAHAYSLDSASLSLLGEPLVTSGCASETHQRWCPAPGSTKCFHPCNAYSPPCKPWRFHPSAAPHTIIFLPLRGLHPSPSPPHSLKHPTEHPTPGTPPHTGDKGAEAPDPSKPQPSTTSHARQRKHLS